MVGVCVLPPTYTSPMVCVFSASSQMCPDKFNEKSTQKFLCNRLSEIAKFLTGLTPGGVVACLVYASMRGVCPRLFIAKQGSE